MTKSETDLILELIKRIQRKPRRRPVMRGPGTAVTGTGGNTDVMMQPAAGKPPKKPSMFEGLLGSVLRHVFARTLGLAGGTINALSNAGGAGIAALSTMPLNMGSTLGDSTRQRYGELPSAAMGRILAGLGAAAGLGVAGVGNALGGEIQHISKDLDLIELEKRAMQNMRENARYMAEQGLSPYAWDVSGRYLPRGPHGK